MEYKERMFTDSVFLRHYFIQIERKEKKDNAHHIKPNYTVIYFTWYFRKRGPALEIAAIYTKTVDYSTETESRNHSQSIRKWLRIRIYSKVQRNSSQD